MADRSEGGVAIDGTGAVDASPDPVSSNVVRLPLRRPAPTPDPAPAAAPAAAQEGTDGDLAELMEAIGGSAAMVLATLPEGHPARLHAARIEALAAEARARTPGGRRPIARRFDLAAALADGLNMARPLVPPALALDVRMTEGPLMAHGAPFDAVRLLVGLVAASRDAALSGRARSLRIEIDRIVPAARPLPVAGRLVPGRAYAALRVMHAALDPVAPGRGTALVDVARVARAAGGALRACAVGEETGIEVLWPLAAEGAPDLAGCIVLLVGGASADIVRAADLLETAGAEIDISFDADEAVASLREDVGEWDCAVVAGDAGAMPAAAIARALRGADGGLPVVIAGEPGETLAEIAAVTGAGPCGS